MRAACGPCGPELPRPLGSPWVSTGAPDAVYPYVQTTWGYGDALTVAVY
jgi:hypothetical protein